MSTQPPGQHPPSGVFPPPPGVSPPPAVPALSRTAYTPWSRRVAAWVIDFAPSLVGVIVYTVGYVVAFVRQFTGATEADTAPTWIGMVNPLVIVGLVIIIGALPWNLYNRWIVGGTTGQSLGKRVVGTTLVSEQTDAPLGAGMAFLRDLVHTLDGVAYVGYLWPLWDEKRQTLADKLMQTVVKPAKPVSTPAAARTR